MGSKIGYLGRFQEFKCLEQIISTPNAYWNRPILSNYACIREEVYTLQISEYWLTGGVLSYNSIMGGEGGRKHPQTSWIWVRFW